MVNSFATIQIQRRLKTPRRPGVTPLANGEVITAECALAIVASHTALRFAGSVMIRRFGCSNLPSLRLPRSNLMAVVARQLLRRAVFAMAETHPKSGGRLWGSGITARLVAGAA
jgi:hypothetical protein